MGWNEYYRYERKVSIPLQLFNGEKLKDSCLKMTDLHPFKAIVKSV
ncbi:hypothetical protein [Staphylococcus chromogenes]|nr:hypothetical protein [Staphylococcus chromogenes]